MGAYNGAPVSIGGDGVGDLERSKVYVYDTTLRDGAQGEGVSFTVGDKIKIVKLLDKLGAHYIEAGNPGSNPKDMEFFQELTKLKLENAKIAAFGSTRRPHTMVEDDVNLQAILQANTPAVAVFGKSWDFHVTDIIKTTLEENLRMIKDTVSYLKKAGKEVIFDAEHFFDGMKENREYALEVLKTATKAGADWLVLCDTNGGTMTSEIVEMTKTVRGAIYGSDATASSLGTNTLVPRIGIHCHNDCEMAVANTIAAVQVGAVQVQGTVNGYGERCGNANLCSVIPNLQLKLGYKVLPKNKLMDLTKLSRHISELANKAHDEQAPFVGNNAFAHKGGMHIDGVMKASKSFEHITPDFVGNHRRILMSEVSGRSTILERVREVAPQLTKNSAEIKTIMDKLKSLEHEGYQFEGAESSFELMVRRTLGTDKDYFTVMDFSIISEKRWDQERCASAIMKVQVDGKDEITAAEGDGPVNAMDKALRKALCVFYPQLQKMRLSDYKVRVLDTTEATGAKVRVLIESTDGDRVWGTVGVSTNIIEASMEALVDSIEYYLEKGGLSYGDDNDTEDFSGSRRA